MDWFLYDSDLYHERVKDVWQDPKYTSAISYNVSPEAVTQRCSVKQVFLKISQNLQENTCVRVSFCFPVNFTKFLRTIVSLSVSLHVVRICSDWDTKVYAMFICKQGTIVYYSSSNSWVENHFECFHVKHLWPQWNGSFCQFNPFLYNVVKCPNIL